MNDKIEPRNRMAQLHYRAAGNPVNAMADSTISNCFPGLECDFKAFWRRAFVGIVLQEWDNYVVDVDVEHPELSRLKGHRLLKVDGRATVTTVSGPQIPGGDPVPLTSGSNPSAVISMEWSNLLTFVLRRQG